MIGILLLEFPSSPAGASTRAYHAIVSHLPEEQACYLGKHTTITFDSTDNNACPILGKFLEWIHREDDQFIEEIQPCNWNSVHSETIKPITTMITIMVGTLY